MFFRKSSNSPKRRGQSRVAKAEEQQQQQTQQEEEKLIPTTTIEQEQPKQLTKMQAIQLVQQQGGEAPAEYEAAQQQQQEEQLQKEEEEEEEEQLEEEQQQPVLTADDETVVKTNPPSKAKSRRRSVESSLELEEELARTKELLLQEKEGKRKLFTSLVKLANELKRSQSESKPLMRHNDYANQAWYEGGMWRAPRILPGVENMAKNQKMRTRLREAISLSNLFFNLVIVTAFTRVGTAISERNRIDFPSFLYFAVFWNVWNKEASYSSRFDTTDLSAQVEALVICFATLFGSLSTMQPIDSPDSNRIVVMAAFVAILHLLLHVRVAYWNRNALPGTLEEHVRQYAVFNVGMNLLEALIWVVGSIIVPLEGRYRWAVFVGGIVAALRVPRAFLANDFHAASSKRGVLFILLLGFMLQSVVVVASPFFEYQSPTLGQYGFIGASCLLLFCIKLLYVEDSTTLAEDHALLVNRIAGFCFNVGQFSLLLSTTVMGSGLSLLTHSYLAATAALPSEAKNLVCGGFSAVILSIFFIKSMHLRRVPVDRHQRTMFIGAYAIQTLVLFAIAGVTAAMCFGHAGYLEVLMQNDIELLFVLSGFALLLVVMGWLDEGVELSLYSTAEDSREFLVHPFGFWWCLKPEVSKEELDNLSEEESGSSSRLSILSPLLGSSVANMKFSQRNLTSYDSLTSDEPHRRATLL